MTYDNLNELKSQRKRTKTLTSAMRRVAMRLNLADQQINKFAEDAISENVTC